MAAFEGHDLRGLLEHYWSFSAETPEALRRAFVTSALRAALVPAAWWGASVPRGSSPPLRSWSRAPAPPPS